MSCNETVDSGGGIWRHVILRLRFFENELYVKNEFSSRRTHSNDNETVRTIHAPNFTQLVENEMCKFSLLKGVRLFYFFSIHRFARLRFLLEKKNKHFSLVSIYRHFYFASDTIRLNVDITRILDGFFGKYQSGRPRPKFVALLGIEPSAAHRNDHSRQTVTNHSSPVVNESLRDVFIATFSSSDDIILITNHYFRRSPVIRYRTSLKPPGKIITIS